MGSGESEAYSCPFYLALVGWRVLIPSLLHIIFGPSSLLAHVCISGPAVRECLGSQGCVDVTPKQVPAYCSPPALVPRNARVESCSEDRRSALRNKKVLLSWEKKKVCLTAEQQVLKTPIPAGSEGRRQCPTIYPS